MDDVVADIITITKGVQGAGLKTETTDIQNLIIESHADELAIEELVGRICDEVG
jgi:hypothetical protein